MRCFPNSGGDTKQGCHLAFLKLFARNKMVWPFGPVLAFFECGQKSKFKGLFSTNLIKFQTFHEIVNFNLVISTNLL
jgi:hypothetical protein